MDAPGDSVSTPSLSSATASGDAMAATCTPIGSARAYARISVARYTTSGPIRSSGTAAMSVEMSVVMLARSRRDRREREPHQAARGGGCVREGASLTDDIATLACTIQAAPVVSSTNTPKPTHHQRAWSDRSMFGSTSVG